MDSFLLGIAERAGYRALRATGEGAEGKCAYGDCPAKRWSFRLNMTSDPRRWGRWICHGCGRRGDAIDLVRAAYSCTPAEAITIVKERAVDRLASQGTEAKPEPLSPRLIEPYRRVLSAYLMGRGFHEDAIWYYRIGFDTHAMEVVAPTYSIDGRTLVGISRRRVGPGQPFVHEPFPDKSSHLFGLDLALRKTRDEGLRPSIIVVEGQLDCLGLGPITDIPVVASMGSSLSEAQAQLLLAHYHQIIIAYDNDFAGVKGTLRAIDTLAAKGSTSTAILAYNALDPGDLAKTADPQISTISTAAWKRLNHGSIKLIQARKQYGTHTRR